MSKSPNDITHSRTLKNKIIGLDIIKSLAIILVVSLHSGLWKVDFISSGLIQNTLQYACRLLCEGVPVFVMVNGFLLLGEKKWDKQKHIHRTIRLLAILLLWIAILIFAGSGIVEEQLTIESFFNYYFATALGSNYTGVLWFLQNLIAVYLIFPVLKIVYDHHRKVFFYLFLLFAVYTVGTQTLSWITSLLEISMNVDMLRAFASFINRFNPTGNGYYVYCFMLGGILNNYKEWLIVHQKRLVLLGILSGVSGVAIAVYLSYKTGVLQSTSFNYSSIFMTGIMIGLMGAFLPTKHKNNIIHRFLESFGSSTMGIYLLHIIIIWLTNRYLIMEDTFAFRLLRCVIIIILCYLLTLIIKRIPLLRRIMI